jgi:two-component system, cell cycle sensor histidine kinase and response regulator CckA
MPYGLPASGSIARVDCGRARVGATLSRMSARDAALRRVLVVEEEGIVAADLGETLTELGYQVIGTVDTADAAIAGVAALAPDIVLMDVRLAGPRDGIAAAAELRRRRDVPVVFLTAYSDDETLARARETGTLGYVVKPFRAPELRCAIELALYKHEIDRRLQERERWLHTTMRSIGDAVVATDREHRVTFLNPVAQALVGCTESAAIGKPLDEILRLVDERTGQPVESPLRRAMASKEIESLQRDASLVGAAGTATPIDDRAAPILDDQGAVLGGVMVFRDVIEQRRIEDDLRRLNRELEERTSQLEAANRELEAFSFSVAHDLRTPLFAIDGFSQLLMGRHVAGLSPKGLEHLQGIRDSTKRMGQLIDDLLRLSLVVRTEFRASEVDLSALAGGILGGLTPSRTARITIEPDLIVRGDESLLHIALGNLLSNAWKFTGKVALPEIEFGRTERDGAPVYFVRDNGAGFDMRQAARLFGAFQRLHARQDFEGNGIGLAIVQRIVHRHGGRVWAEGDEGRGATFSFTLGG